LGRIVETGACYPIGAGHRRFEGCCNTLPSTRTCGKKAGDSGGHNDLN